MKKKHENYDEAVEFLKDKTTCYSAILMRHFDLGYNSAGMLIDELEDNKIIGAFEGSKGRRVLLHTGGEGFKTCT